MEENMRSLFNFVVIATFSSFIAGCGEKDYTGAYRFKDDLVLNIQKDQAAIFSEEGGNFSLRSSFKTTVSGDKLFLDSKNNEIRVVMKRNVDERSLDCLNCKVIHFPTDEIFWRYDSHGPYDLDSLLKEQEVKNKEKALKDKAEAEEKARKDKELAARLSTYEGTLEHVVGICMQKGGSRKFCECPPKELRKMGVSDATFIKLTKPGFRPSNRAEEVEAIEYAGSVRRAAMQCVVLNR